MSDENRIWTIPNILSIVRLLILFPILHALVHERPLWFLFWILVSIGSDFLDGFIARRFDQKSNLGRVMDPIIDKLNILVVGSYLAFSPKYLFPIWFFSFLLCRELLLMLGSLVVIRRKHQVLESNRPGKNSAFFIGIAILLTGLNLQPYAIILVWIAFVLTVYSTWVYFRVFLKQIKSSKKKAAKW